MKKILITGASGLIGTRLTRLLVQQGYTVNHLGRNKRANQQTEGAAVFTWDIEKGRLDKQAFDGVEAIVHLAGAGVADKRWTPARKKEIMDSRVKSADLLLKFLKTAPHDIKTFVSASAVGYYGHCGNEVVTEDHVMGEGFLAEVCQKWEEGARRVADLGIREVRCRIGIVLSAHGGALPELTKTTTLGVAAYFAKKNLYYPWIHIDDVCGIIIHALQNENVIGAYNTTSNQPLLMQELMQRILAAKKSKALLVGAPPLGIQLAMGEMSEMLLNSQRCTAQKIMDSGYAFKFGSIEAALKDIYG